MNFGASLFMKNQEKNIRKSFSLRRLFNLLFIISLGLNVYFLVPENELDSVVNLDSVELTGKKIAEESRIKNSIELKNFFLDKGLKENIHEEESTQNFYTTETSSHTVESVLFSPSVEPNGPNIQALKLKVKNSLNYTVCQQTKLGSECDAFSAYLARLLVWFLDINKEMYNGDTLDVVYKRLDNEGTFKILQLVYQSSFLNKTLEANFFKEEEMKYGGYFDRDGKEVAQRLLKKQSPIDNYVEIVSLPGDFRKGRKGHFGTDFKADVGSTIRSTFDGRISRVNWNRRANGYCIEIIHPNQKIKTRYLHLSRVLVKRGQYVKQGEKIAESGNTGRSFAPHLHYEVRSLDKKNKVYNPFNFKYHKTYHRNISDKGLGEFEKIISTYATYYQKNKTDRNVGKG
jgi:murein DD-endopeptidase